jgi:hypothetical protein
MQYYCLRAGQLCGAADGKSGSYQPVGLVQTRTREFPKIKRAGYSRIQKCYKGNWGRVCYVSSPNDQFDLRLGFDRHRRVSLFLSAAVCAHSQMAVAHRWRGGRLLRPLLALGRLHQRQHRSKTGAIRPMASRGGYAHATTCRV